MQDEGNLGYYKIQVEESRIPENSRLSILIQGIPDANEKE